MLFSVEAVDGKATGLRLEEKDRAVLMLGCRPAVASAVVIAHQLPAAGGAGSRGAGGRRVFYGSVLTGAPALHGEDVVVVASGNSAGQAACHLSRFARRVTLVARTESLAKTMSDYLVGELRTLENVTVRPGTQRWTPPARGWRERVTLATAGSGTRNTVLAAALFVLICGEPRTARAVAGYIRTGLSWLAGAWPLCQESWSPLWRMRGASTWHHLRDWMSSGHPSN